jgi:N6-L-threonylcarbamoyladenine synthase
VVETVVDRLRQGLRIFRQRFGAPSALVAAGGVAANRAIRDALLDVASRDRVALVIPPPSLCTDNAAMIAWAGAERLVHGLCDTLDTAPRARWPLDQVTKPAPPPFPPPQAVEGREGAIATAPTTTDAAPAEPPEMALSDSVRSDTASSATA